MTQPTSTPSLTQLEIANFLKIENWPGIENMVKILTPYADKIATFPKERMKTADLVILGIAKSAHSFLVGYWDPTINVFRPLSRVGAFTSWDNIRTDALRHVTREDEHFIYTEPRIVVGVRYRRATRESLLGGFISNVRENADPKGCSKPLKIHFQKAPLL
jgi:ATP-dependent DNA ligase